MTRFPRCAQHGSRDCGFSCVVMEHRPDPLTSARIWLQVNERGLRNSRNDKTRAHYRRRVERNRARIAELEQERQAA